MVKHMEGGSKRASSIAGGMHSTATYYSPQGPIMAPPSQFAFPNAHAAQPAGQGVHSTGTYYNPQGPIMAPPSQFAVPTAQPAGRSSWSQYLRSCFEGVRFATCAVECLQNVSECLSLGDCCSDVGSMFQCF